MVFGDSSWASAFGFPPCDGLSGYIALSSSGSSSNGIPCRDCRCMSLSHSRINMNSHPSNEHGIVLRGSSVIPVPVRSSSFEVLVRLFGLSVDVRGFESAFRLRRCFCMLSSPMWMDLMWFSRVALWVNDKPQAVEISQLLTWLSRRLLGEHWYSF